MNDTNRKTILFVEDEIELNRIVSIILEREFNVMPALSGREALEKLEQTRVDAILLDLEMPHMNGIEFLRHFRSSGNNTPVIIVTGNSCREHAEQAADLGVQGYVIKPYGADELIGRLRKVICPSEKGEGGVEAAQINYHPKLKEALDYIERNYEKDLSISKFTKNTGISYSHLAGLFNQEMGMSLTCYLNRFRVGKAKALIQDTDLPLKDIMTRSGFRTEQHFFKQFKRFAGVTPMSLKQKSPIRE